MTDYGYTLDSNDLLFPQFDGSSENNLQDQELSSTGYRESFDYETLPLQLPSYETTPISLIRRELGKRPGVRQVQNKHRDLHRSQAWTGASKDVLSVAWGPNDSTFAVGASADHLDDHGVPYNRGNNLLLGIPHKNQVLELSSHFVDRPFSSSEPDRRSGQSYADPRLFTTVSHVSFSGHHNTLYSAGYDKVVRVWDVTSTSRHGSEPSLALELQHDARVDMAAEKPAHSRDEPRLLVTGQQSLTEPIRLYGLPSEEMVDVSNTPDTRRPIATLSSDRALKFSIFPSAIQWGPDASTRHFLLAGFAESSQNELKDREGHLLLWNAVRPEQLIHLGNATESVFDVAWQPGRAVFAAAMTPRNTTSLTYRQDTKSVIRTWSPTEDSRQRVYELECPAVDINELKFHDRQQLITAGCTDNRVYVWDFRMTDKILMTLQHGQPIETFQSHLREKMDVGVRFCDWAQNGRHLYTGASDGRLCCWDVLASPDDDEIAMQEVTRFDAGIMAGAFSSDGSRLLVGLVKGSIEILAVGGPPKTKGEQLDLIMSEETKAIQRQVASEDDDNIGTRVARELKASGQLRQSEVGIVQGPAYRGPWSRDARRKGAVDLASSPLLPDVAAKSFDKATRREGRQNGGKYDHSVRDRKLAKTINRAIKETRAGREHLRPRATLTPYDDFERGPDTEVLTSLIDLATLGDSEPSSKPHVSHEIADNQVLQPVPIKAETDVATSQKRAAGHDFALPQRKRSETPKVKQPQPVVKDIPIDIIDLCDSDDEPSTPKAPQAQARITSDITHTSLFRTPSRRSENAVDHPNGVARTETNSPSSQRSIVVPGSEGEMGFIIPARFMLSPSSKK